MLRQISSKRRTSTYFCYSSKNRLYFRYRYRFYFSGDFITVPHGFVSASCFHLFSISAYCLLFSPLFSLSRLFSPFLPHFPSLPRVFRFLIIRKNQNLLIYYLLTKDMINKIMHLNINYKVHSLQY